MDLSFAFARLGMALGLGLLVGLQREHTEKRLAGIRTFPLATLLGAICALLALEFGGLLVSAGLLCVVGMLIADRFVHGKSKGLTTEAALLVMYTVGALAVVGTPTLALAIGAGVAILLQMKETLHGFSDKLSDADVSAIMQFALITLVALPILPDETFGPYDVLNPRHIWTMVVLIVGINLGGYISHKFLGDRAGLLTGGVLGGLISSTATTVTYSRSSRRSGLPEPAVVVITLASTILFARILVELAVVAPAAIWRLAPPLTLMLAISTIVSASAWRGRRGATTLELPNPSELKTAFAFAAIYAVVLLAVAAAKDHFGDRGLYVVAVLSGLTDVDAITLSTGRLVQEARIPPDTGWRVVLIAALANLVFKAGIVAAMAHRAVLHKVLLLWGLVTMGGITVLWLG